MKKPSYITLTNYFKGQASKSDIEWVEIWSRENQAEFYQLKSIWEEFGSLATSYQPDLAEAWKNIDGRTPDDQSLNLYWLPRIAAALLVAVSLVWYWGFKVNTSWGVTSAETLVAGKVMLENTLSDGSLVSISPLSSVQIEEGYGTHHRKVVLGGKAFFEVNNNPQIPFVLEASDAVITVLGTSFLVDDKERELLLIVEEGEVALKIEEKEYRVENGKMAFYDKSNGSVRISEEKDPNYLAWKTGVLHFEDQDINRFARTIEEHYKVQITIDKSQSRRRISSTFNLVTQDIQEVLEIVEATHGFEVKKQGPKSYLIK